MVSFANAIANDKITVIRSISCIISSLVHLSFYLMSIRFITVYLCYLNGFIQIFAIACVIILFLLSCWRTKHIVFLFVSLIPMISGIQELGVMKFAPLVSFVFSVIYFSWYTNRVIRKRKSITFEAKSDVGKLIDSLSFVILLSVFVNLSHYPLEFLIYRLKYASILGQRDPFWFIEASYIVLQGMMIFRIIESFYQKNDNKIYIASIYIQTFTILFFSLVQIFFNIPKKVETYTYSPFQDVHSYSAYLLMSMFFFYYRFLFEKKIFNGILATALLLCVYASGSTASLISLIIFGLIFLGIISISKKFKTRLKIVVIIILIFAPFALYMFFPGSSDKYASRFNLERLKNSGTIKQRVELWGQTINVIKTFPLTGSGIGTFFTKSHLYSHNIEVKPHKYMNAHNYYLQLASEIGIPALLLFFLIIFSIYRNTAGSIESIHNGGFLIGIGAYLFTMVSGHHLLLSVQQFLFWYILSFIYNSSKAEINKKRNIFETHYVFLGSFAIIIIVLFGYYSNVHLVEIKTKGPQEYGFYRSVESDEQSMTWVMKYSYRKIYAKSNTIEFSMYAEPEHLSSGVLEVDIYINNKKKEKVRWEKKGIKHMEYNIPNIKDTFVSIFTNASDSYNPYKIGLTHNIRENRDQSIMLSDIDFKDIIGIIN